LVSGLINLTNAF